MVTKLLGGLVTVGVLVLLGAAWTAWGAYRLEREGLVASATVLERHVFRGSTFVELEFDVPGGARVRTKVQESRGLKAPSPGGLVEVRYLAGAAEDAVFAGDESGYGTALTLGLLGLVCVLVGGALLQVARRGG